MIMTQEKVKAVISDMIDMVHADEVRQLLHEQNVLQWLNMEMEDRIAQVDALTRSN